ncbi:uncharacterized protein LOC127452836 [Myxocyprinus asiaticus]|uniref:uncharacterized protein LOC127452836 n=1 Tax=Myxocyprinus asiaticus TaxID=70543 RepID=UPI002222FA34|nr:uncharacterized protein LOC127452836 [Myxocyprinus asiaticus]
MSKKEWISHLKKVKEVSGRPLYSNVIFGFLMLGLEKLVEMEFACPCHLKFNLIFSVAYFLCPALFSFSLMFYIQRPLCNKKDSNCLLSTATCITPAIVWVMLLFFDGQYLACARTSWEGLTVHTDIAASTTWCKPLNKPDNITEKQMEFFNFRNISQAVGLAILVMSSLIILCCGCKGCTCKSARTEKPEAERVEMGDPDSSPTPPPDRASLMEDQASAESEKL